MLEGSHVIPVVVTEFEQRGKLRCIDILNIAVHGDLVHLVPLPLLQQEVHSKAGPVRKQSALDTRYFDIRKTARQIKLAKKPDVVVETRLVIFVACREDCEPFALAARDGPFEGAV